MSPDRQQGLVLLAGQAMGLGAFLAEGQELADGLPKIAKGAVVGLCQGVIGGLGFEGEGKGRVQGAAGASLPLLACRPNRARRSRSRQIAVI